MIHLFLAVTCSLLAAGLSIETVVTCVGIQHLICDEGVISVQNARYGRTNTQTCSAGRPPQQLSNTACSLQGTFDLVRTRCDGKKMCELNVDDVQTSDPCAGTFKYLQTNYTCSPAHHRIVCERSSLDLHCEDGQVISVYGADYGRRDSTTCSYRAEVQAVRNVLCSSPTSVVADRCNGRSRCTIAAENSVFGDPCKGTFKYLELAYGCQYPV